MYTAVHTSYLRQKIYTSLLRLQTFYIRHSVIGMRFVYYYVVLVLRYIIYIIIYRYLHFMHA